MIDLTERKYVMRLPDAYSKGIESNNNKLLQINQEAVKEIYKSISEVIAVLDLDNAEGKILEDYGEMLDVYRGKLNDKQYRAVIKAIIAANISKSDYMSVMHGLDYIFGKNNAHISEVEDSIATVKLDDMPYANLLETGLEANQIKDLVKKLIAVAVQIEESHFWGTFEFGKATLKTTASGNPVVLNDLEGVTFSEITVRGKNLISYPYEDTTKTLKGITFTDNGDGSVTVNGKATTVVHFYMASPMKLERGTYTISSDVGTVVVMVVSSSFKTYASVRSGSQSFTLDEATEVMVLIRVLPYSTCNNIVCKPMLELGDTATEYASPITGQELTVTACGKNLVKYPYYETTKTENGITFTDNGDGTITVNGTATSHATFYLDTTITLLAGVHYVLSGAPTSTITSYRIQFAGATWEPIFACYGEPVDIVVEQDTRFRQFRIVVPSGSTCENVVFKPMIEIGSTATPYEPYSGADYTITPDSNPYTVPFEIEQLSGTNTLYVSETGMTLDVIANMKNPENHDIEKGWGNIEQTIGGYFGTIIGGVTSVRTRKPKILIEPINTRIAYNKPAKVTLSCKTNGAKIYYTTDGTDPSDLSTLYTEPFELYSGGYLGVTKTIKAIAYSDSLDPSIISEHVITWKPALIGTFEFASTTPIYNANAGFGNVEQTIGGYVGEVIDYIN